MPVKPEHSVQTLGAASEYQTTIASKAVKQTVLRQQHCFGLNPQQANKKQHKKAHADNTRRRTWVEPRHQYHHYTHVG